MLRAVCGLGTEAVQRWVLGADVSTRGGDRLGLLIVPGDGL